MAKIDSQLKQILQQLDSQQQQSVKDFAGFLLSQQSPQPDTQTLSEEKQEPEIIPRPADENVINAIKRLRKTYFMLNTDDLLNQTSTFMAQFMIQGRAANEVIDDLEALFQQHYQEYLNPND